MPEQQPDGLRERKRRRTRAAILTAACRLFDEQGYDATTVTQIAEAADIAPRTFFGYFPSKEQLLFPEAEERIEAAVEAVTTAGPTDDPVAALLGAVEQTLQAGDELSDRVARLRVRLIRAEPKVRLLGAQFQLRAVDAIAAALLRAYPRMPPIRAGALAGAFVGAAAGAASAAVHHPKGTRGRVDPEQVRAAVAAVLVTPADGR